MTDHPSRRRLARRLLAAHGLVIAAGAVTLTVVALLVSQPLFHLHVGRALGPVTEPVGRHLDQALSTTLLLSLGIGTGAAVLTALAVSWALSSRLARPIEELSDTTGQLARGNLSARAARPAVDDELADLTASVNDMAASLEHTEETRRRLLADLAHELRTPLSTIEGYLEGLADGVVEPDDATWSTLQGATGRLRRLVRDVALVSRAEEGRLDLQLEPTDPGDLVAAAVASARDHYERAAITLATDVGPDIDPVEVDPDRAHQVLGNLLDNARRHTPEGGRVVVRAHQEVSGDVTIVVEDDGAGIDSEDLPRVFERFYRGDTSRPSGNGSGSGIGLTIARAIARAHRGDLTVSSAGPGRGSRFEWRLSRHGGDAPE